MSDLHYYLNSSLFILFVHLFGRIVVFNRYVILSLSRYSFIWIVEIVSHSWLAKSTWSISISRANSWTAHSVSSWSTSLFSERARTGNDCLCTFLPDISSAIQRRSSPKVRLCGKIVARPMIYFSSLCLTWRGFWLSHFIIASKSDKFVKCCQLFLMLWQWMWFLD